MFYALKKRFLDPPQLTEYVLEILRQLRQGLAEAHGLTVIMQDAYADFEKLDASAQNPLYLQGVGTHNVAGTEHKNAADMRLCVDAVSARYTHRELEAFVFVAGDRDYIPVILHLRRQNRQVWVASFREAASGDLVLIIGDDRFLDLIQFLTPESRGRLDRHVEQVQTRLTREHILREQGLPALRRVEEIAAPAATAPAATAPASAAPATTAPAPAARAAGGARR